MYIVVSQRPGGTGPRGPSRKRGCAALPRGVAALRAGVHARLRRAPATHTRACRHAAAGGEEGRRKNCAAAPPSSPLAGAQRPRGTARRSPASAPIRARSSCSARRASPPARRTRCRRQILPTRAHARRFEHRAQPAPQLRPASSGRPRRALSRPAPARSTPGRGQPRHGHAPQAHRQRAGLTHLLGGQAGGLRAAASEATRAAQQRRSRWARWRALSVLSNGASACSSRRAAVRRAGLSSR